MLELFSAWLAPVRAKIPADLSPEDSKTLTEAVTQEALRRFAAFLSGVREYQTASAVREDTGDVAVVWEKGTTRLLDYAPSSKGAMIFVVPSLVNRFEILDIDPDHSFLRFLVKEGFRPMVIDWQEPGPEERGFTLSEYIECRLLPALTFVFNQSAGKPCHVLGYCMGGLMALALALLKPEQIATLTLLATPWDFAVKGVGGVPAVSSYLGSLFVQQARAMESYLENVGFLPPQMLQAVFTSFQSLQVLQKFTRFGSGASNEAEMRRFVLTEDWLNNGVPLALPVAMECLGDWYEKNSTAALQWKVADTLIDPREVARPTYVLVPSRDKIVPPESALPLASLIPEATLHNPDIGHIGVMTGDEAPEKVWNHYAAWLRARTV